jgi:hypothetical protein
VVIRHVALWKMKADAPADAGERVAEAFKRINADGRFDPSFAVGPAATPLGGSTPPWDYAAVFDYSGPEERHAFYFGPDHEQLVAELDPLRPMIEEMTSFSYEVED